MTGLLDIPFDVFTLILRQVTVQDISKLQETCRQLRDTLDERALWAEINRVFFKLFPTMDHQDDQKDNYQALKNRALYIYRLRVQWTNLPRAFFRVVPHPLFCSVELLPGGSHFVAASTNGILSLHRVGHPRAVFSIQQSILSTIWTKVLVSPPIIPHTITIVWLICRAKVFEVHIYALRGESLILVNTATTQLLVQRFSLKNTLLAVSGYALRAEHRSYVEIMTIEHGAEPRQMASISLDDTIDAFGELLGLSILDDNNLLVCCRRGVVVFVVSSPSHFHTQSEPVWSGDLSDHYSHPSECSIGYPICLHGTEGTTLMACSIVTGDRFFLFGMIKRPSGTTYTVRPLEMFEPSVLDDDDEAMDTNDDDGVEEFRDRTAKLMRCNASTFAVWLSSEREQIMTANISPLSLFSAEERDALGCASGSLYGHDTLPYEFAVGGIDPPVGLDFNLVDQLSLDELSGRVGIFSKATQEFLIMAPSL